MKANAVARNYGCLTPEERFRLILAANGRGDDAERERLVNAGGRITLSMFDHAPLVDAFDEITLLVFVELLAEGSSYLESPGKYRVSIESYDDTILFDARALGTPRHLAWNSRWCRDRMIRMISPSPSKS
jgi:hypothetical protein